MIKSPLRYPGGKSRIVDELLNYVPENSDDMTLYEPFVGGGVFFLNAVDIFKNTHINDLDPRVSQFWKYLIESPAELMFEVRKIAPTKQFYYLFRELPVEDTLEYTAKWFCANRTAFNGNTTNGGYSGTTRFTESNIRYLQTLGEKLQTFNIKVTNTDYSKIFDICGNGFMFLDPPYLDAEPFYLDHKQFDHHRLRELIGDIKSPWIMTYDIRAAELYNGYGMVLNTFDYCSSHSKKTEVIIMNHGVERRFTP